MLRRLFLGWMLFANQFALAAGTVKSAPVVICLGDSLTEGYEISPDAAYPALLEKKLKEKFGPGATVINAGISGATSASGEERLRFQLKATQRPTHLILALGANDGLRGLPVAAMHKNLENTVKVARSSNMKVLLAGMKVPPNYGAAYTKSFDSTFKKLARELKIPLIPFLLEGVAARQDLNLPDGIHPNPAGHKIIVETVWKHLEPML
jgi:acyl-CoA thioesterase-1